MTRLVAYAGYDPTDADCGYEYRKRTSIRALRMFRNRKDTMEIAKALHARECTVVRWLDEERNREYEARNA